MRVVVLDYLDLTWWNVVVLKAIRANVVIAIYVGFVAAVVAVLAVPFILANIAGKFFVSVVRLAFSGRIPDFELVTLIACRCFDFRRFYLVFFVAIPTNVVIAIDIGFVAAVVATVAVLVFSTQVACNFLVASIRLASPRGKSKF